MRRTIEKVAAGLCLGLMVAAALPASAESISKDAMRRKLLDYCVFTQYRVKDIDRNAMIKRCDCSADQALVGLGDGNYESPSRDKLSGPQEKAAREAITACFQKK